MPKNYKSYQTKIFMKSWEYTSCINMFLFLGRFCLYFHPNSSVGYESMSCSNPRGYTPDLYYPKAVILSNDIRQWPLYNFPQSKPYLEKD